LEALDPNNVSQLAIGRDVRAGFMIDHIGNFQRSAQQGLPIYRLTGGAGYVWAASWDQRGTGTLRFLTIDASAIDAQLSNAGANVEPGAEPNQKEPLSIEEVDAMKAAMAKNWDPSGYKGIVTVRVRLNPDGRLSAEPQIVTKSDDSKFPAASNSALRAVLAGQPYKMLKPTSYEAWKYMDIDFDPSKLAISGPPRVVDADPATVQANIDFIRATRTKISDQLAAVRNVESRQKLEEIAARLATANIQMSSADLKTLKNDADAAAQILRDTEEFGHVSEIASRRMAVINDALAKITSDAPVIQKIQAAIKAVRLAQGGTSLRTLQDALKTLNDSYDNNRQALQALQFQSP
jgi:hypothetical protein